MNRRERFLATLTFGRPDRPAAGDYFYYESTRRRWESEGLPPGVDLNDYFGMDFDPFRWVVPVRHGILPTYEPQVLEDTTEYTITRQAGGEIVKVLKNTPPPAMPQWIRYPLESRDDWSDFKRRLDPDTPGRLPDRLADLATDSARRDYPLGLWVGGSYGVLRNWWGLERVSMLFYDDPALIEEMIDVLTHLSVRLLDRVLQAGVVLDWVMFWEDLGYKTGPLLSPAMFRRWCLPFYRAVMDRVQKAGIPVVMVDSDGNVQEMIPLWLDVGVTVLHPMEVAAGMDVVATRRRYGRRVGFFGGIDKRLLAGPRERLRPALVPLLEACFADGGFIPACDHAIPPDVSLDNYRFYRDIVREVGQR